MKKIILLIGSISGRSVEFYQNNHDLKSSVEFYTLLDYSVSEEHLARARKSFAKVLLCDFSDDASILEALLSYRQRIVSVGCISDSKVEDLAKVLPMLPYTNVPSQASVLWAHDKYAMRQMVGVVNRDVTVRAALVTRANYGDALSTLATLTFPVMVKPTNLHSSILTQRVEDLHALDHVLRAGFSQEGINNVRFLVEEFIEGSAHSIDGVVDKYGKVTCYPVVDQVVGTEAGFEEYFIYKSSVPSVLSQEDVGAVENAVQSVVEAIALRSSHFHIEVKKTDVGVKIIEIAPRYGFKRNVIYSNAYGIDLIGNQHFVQYDDRRVTVEKKLRKYCAVYKVYPKKEGVVSGYTDCDVLKQKNGVIDVKPNKNLTIGSTFISAKHGGKPMFIAVTVCHSDRDVFSEACAFVEENAKIW